MKYLVLLATMMCACTSAADPKSESTSTNQDPSQGAWVEGNQNNADPCADYTRTISEPDGGSYTFTVHTFCGDPHNPDVGDPAPFINKGDPAKVEKTNAISR